MRRRTAAIDVLLEDSRRGLDRVQPADLAAELAAGALVIDTRPIDQRDRDGDLPGALIIDRNVLEWRLDPSCPHTTFRRQATLTVVSSSSVMRDIAQASRQQHCADSVLHTPQI